MAAGAKGDPITSPWSYVARDYVSKVLSITVTFNNATRALISATIHRDAGCMYRKIYIGIGADGTPDTATRTFNVGNLEGDQVFNAAQMSSRGLSVIEDVLAMQITAGP